jgi:hypothetical protein
MEINNPSVLAEITAIFERYEKALVDNDVPVLEELFWDSGLTLRYGVNELLYGIDEIRAFRRGRPGDGPRTLRHTVITTYGTDYATANTEFVRERMNTKLGRQSQTWVRMPEGWRVVAAHVSLMDKVRP